MNELLVAAMLLAVFALVAARGPRAAAGAYAAQSLALATLAALEGARRGSPGLYACSALTFGVKGVALPLLLGRRAGLAEARRLDKGRLGFFEPLAGAGLLVAAFALAPAEPLWAGALSLAFIGLLLVAARARPLSRFLAFSQLESGAVLLAVGTGLPWPFVVQAALDSLLVTLAFALLAREAEPCRSP